MVGTALVQPSIQQPIKNLVGDAISSVFAGNTPAQPPTASTSSPVGSALTAPPTPAQVPPTPAPVTPPEVPKGSEPATASAVDYNAAIAAFVKENPQYADMAAQLEGHFKNVYTGGGGGATSVQQNVYDMFDMGVIDKLFDKFQIKGPADAVGEEGGPILDTTIDKATERDTGFVKKDAAGKPLDGKGQWREWFKDPRVISAMVSALGAMAVGVKPGDALLWGAVGGAEAEKLMAAQHKEQVAQTAVTNDTRVKQNELAIKQYEAKQKGIEARTKKFTAEQTAAIEKYTAGSQVFKDYAEGRAALAKTMTDFVTSSASANKYISDLNAEAVKLTIAQYDAETKRSAGAGGLGIKATVLDINSEEFKDRVQNNRYYLLTGQHIRDGQSPKQAIADMNKLVNGYQIATPEQRIEIRKSLKIAVGQTVTEATESKLEKFFDAIDEE
jgi:hypothetical protein